MRINYHLLFVLILIIFTYSNVNAEVLHWPQLCEGGELQIKNKTEKSFSVWLQKFGTNLIRETEIELTENETITYSLDNITKDEHYSLLNNADKLAVEVNYKCNGKTYASNPFEGGVITYQKTQSSEHMIVVENLYSANNKIQIDLKDKYYNVILSEKVDLSAFKKHFFQIPASLKNWESAQISAESKYSGFYVNDQSNPKPVSVKPQASDIDISATYFVIGPRTGEGDNFVVKVTNADIVAKARDLIKNPQKEKMVFARIQKGHSGYARNWSKPEKSFWSWSVSEVTSFDDLGSTACNGTPQQVEDRVDFWVNDPGQICFWNYRVKKELKSSQVANGL